MEKATLTVCLPRTMKAFIETKLRVGSFSTPSERSLIRVDQDLNGHSEVAALLLRVRNRIPPRPGHEDAAGKEEDRTAGMKSVVTRRLL